MRQWIIGLAVLITPLLSLSARSRRLPRKVAAPLLALAFAVIAIPLRADTLSISLFPTATVAPLSYTYGINALAGFNYSAGYLTTQYNATQQSSETLTASTSATFSNYGLPVGALLTSAYLQSYVDYSNISDTLVSFSNCNCNVAAGEYSVFESATIYGNGVSEIISNGYLDSDLLNQIQLGNSLIESDNAALVLYTLQNEYYCGFSGGCSPGYQNRSVSDAITLVNYLTLTYTPDSAPTILPPGPFSFGAGTTGTLDAQASSALGYGLTYSWLFSNGVTATGADPVLNFSGPNWNLGDYTAKVTVTDPYGYSSSATTDISVVPEPSSWFLLATGIALLSTRLRSRKRS